MKKFMKAMAAVLFVMSAIVLLPVTSKAAVSAPANVRQTAATRNGVRVEWNAVTDTVSEVIGYYTQWSEDGVNWGNRYPVSEGTADVTLNLTAGHSYYVRVATVFRDPLKAEPEISEWSAPLEAVTSPDAGAITQLDLTDVTQNSLTFSWSACPGATSYNILDYSNDTLLATTNAATTTFTWSNLVPNSKYGIKVVPVRTSASGYAAYTNFYSLSNVSTAKSAPGAPSDTSYIGSASSKDFTVGFFAADTSRYSDGYEVEVYKLKGGKKVKTLSAANGYSTNNIKISKNTPYKYRVRYYVTNNGKKTPGAWSKFRYILMQKVNGKKMYKMTSSYSSIKLNWKKVTGATGYTVYASTSRNGKYKKIKTLGKKATGITFTKIGRTRMLRSNTYYCKVVPKVKDGKKTIVNDTQIIQVAN